MNLLKHLHDHVVPNARNNYKPHALAHRSLSLYAGLLISVKLLTFFSVGLLPQDSSGASAVTPQNILELTNLSRSTYGVGPLGENALLDQAAQNKAQDMLANQYFAHNSPQGRTPWNFINSQNYNYIIAGENLAINFYSSEGLEQAWMNSPEHKANILNKDFQDIGIGVVQGTYKGVNAIFVVQMFGTRMDQPFIPKNDFSPTQSALLQNTPLQMPQHAAIDANLAIPSFDNITLAITNKKTFTVSGQAPGAASVYVLVNNQASAQLPVSQDKFSGTVNLNEGKNILNVVAFDSQAQVSKISSGYVLTLDTTAPSVVNSDVKPVATGQNIYYKIDVQVQGDPVKVLATLGTESIMLQPTADQNVWEGTVGGSENLVNDSGKLGITAYDLAGNSSYAPLMNLDSSITSSFGFLANNSYSVSIFGHKVDSSELKLFYLYFIAGLLVLLALTIGLKRNIQHVGIIAHTSAMIVLALVFWIT